MKKNYNRAQGNYIIASSSGIFPYLCTIVGFTKRFTVEIPLCLLTFLSAPMILQMQQTDAIRLKYHTTMFILEISLLHKALIRFNVNSSHNVLP